MNAKFIGCSSFKSKKGNNCYVVNFALFDADDVFLRCSQEFVTEDIFEHCLDIYEFGYVLEVRTFINQFGTPALGLIYA